MNDNASDYPQKRKSFGAPSAASDVHWGDPSYQFKSDKVFNPFRLGESRNGV